MRGRSGTTAKLRPVSGRGGILSLVLVRLWGVGWVVRRQLPVQPASHQRNFSAPVVWVCLGYTARRPAQTCGGVPYLGPFRFGLMLRIRCFQAPDRHPVRSWAGVGCGIGLADFLAGKFSSKLTRQSSLARPSGPRAWNGQVRPPQGPARRELSHWEAGNTRSRDTIVNLCSDFDGWGDDYSSSMQARSRSKPTPVASRRAQTLR